MIKTLFQNIKISKSIRIIISIVFFGIVQLTVTSCGDNITNQGLVGIYYSEPNLTSIKAITVLDNIEQTWDDSVEFQGESSGEWSGEIIAPISGKITFKLASNFSAEVKISESNILKVNKDKPEAELELEMIKDKSYSINLVFLHLGAKADVGIFNLKWRWDNSDYKSIPAENIYHTEKDLAKLDFLKEADPDKIDKSQFIYADAQHNIVYYEKGRFAAWPANNGAWVWGDEILFGFTQGYYKENQYHHAYDRHKPMTSKFARSLDGGKTWTLEEMSRSLKHGGEIKKLKGKINFKTEGFALKNKNDFYHYSYDKGKTWEGPFAYPDFGLGKYTARTDYLVESEGEAYIFTSVKDDKVRASLQDRAITIKTSNGGESFEFVGYMSELDSIRSVMPATVRINENHLVSAMRRRLDPPKNNKFALPKNWIDVYESNDNGVNWSFLEKIGNTDIGNRNGNPPSMVRLKSGKIVVVYGYRSVPYSIRARISSDDGKTWSKEIILRDDARIWDLGYCRSVVTNDDKVVSVYYYSTTEKPERFIAATIWDPNLLIVSK